MSSRVASHAYVGRFAPTPSGPLHFGSLVAALGSFLDARAAGGRWRLRIDDLDRPRVQPGAEAQILRQLEAYGLHWDDGVYRQSEHVDAYTAALDALRREGAIYACHCTRADLQRLRADTATGDEPPYDGRCRNLHLPEEGAALRLRATGPLDDFVVRRRDGQYGYQLACAVDEIALGITDVVRGADLETSTRRQRHLLLRLGATPPRYAHLPLVFGTDGRKLSKQNHAPAIDARDPIGDLRRALAVLGQALPDVQEAPDTASLLARAIDHWRLPPPG